jgi:hypothetical protein
MGRIRVAIWDIVLHVQTTITVHMGPQAVEAHLRLACPPKLLMPAVQCVGTATARCIACQVARATLACTQRPSSRLSRKQKRSRLATGRHKIAREGTIVRVGLPTLSCGSSRVVPGLSLTIAQRLRDRLRALPSGQRQQVERLLSAMLW